MTKENSLSRRQTLIAGATISLAAAKPAFAADQSNSNQIKGTRSMTQDFIETKDGVEIFYKDWGPKDAQPIVFHLSTWTLSSGLMAWMTSVFLARTASASKEIGGSIAVIARSWSTWLGTMSRSAPVFS